MSLGNDMKPLKTVQWFGLKCDIFQVKPSGEDSDQLISSQTVSAPDASRLISDLEAFSRYDFRMACRSSQGVSNWTAWMSVSTREGGKRTPTPILILTDTEGTCCMLGPHCWSQKSWSVFTVARCVRSFSAKHRTTWKLSRQKDQGRCVWWCTLGMATDSKNQENT